MSATLDTDARPEFGRRNGDDDSSSRESSPTRKVARSFTPASDDEVAIEPIADVETPPPDAPLIRASLAFSSTPSVVNTYQASLISKPPHQTLFLPGQEVPIPPLPPKVPKPRKKREARFPTQTGRFRVTSYAHDQATPIAPTPALGTGPYTSLYRATAPAPILNSLDVNGSTEVQASEDAPVTTKKRLNASELAKASTSKAKVTKAKSSAAKSKASAKHNQSSSAVSPWMALQSGSGHAEESSAYEQINNNAESSTSNAQRLQDHKRLKPLRLVTVLIEDVRGEVPDSQLAEVRVALRDSDDTEQDGYWANAEDIVRPAKVYAWRGKYRQVILKVSADNQDDWVSANVVVHPNRTLEVVVESGSPPGVKNPPKDPYLQSRGLEQAPYRAAGESSSSRRTSRKRRHSPSDDYGGRSGHRSPVSTIASSPGPSIQSSFNRSNSNPPAFSGRYPGPPADRHSITRYLNGSESDSFESDAVHAAVAREVDALIQEESNWADYFPASAKRSASGVLECYRIVQSFVDKWVGKRTPSGAVVEKSHIAAALQMDKQEQEKFMSHGAETLHLMALYGPEGQRLRDPEVSKLAHDDSTPGYGQKPERAVLNLLRKLDREWVASHPM
ncbi:hypothetical protein GGX14DRAFT_439018 [Mycena pura]|uniref:Uncharacterized protein n=1 Tax=Mycena pura TaxID=153505 RepID=A0AAD6YF31_9AGAR|nr:hypothetical protein GGX14DRAFT_439018 [Mycena pura]